MDWNFLLGKRRGRIARKPFWIATLAIYGLGVLAVFASYYAAVHHRVLNAHEFSTIVNALISVQLFLMCPVILKRLHDRDRTGWWLIPIWIAPQAYMFFGQHLIDAVSGSFRR